MIPSAAAMRITNTVLQVRRPIAGTWLERVASALSVELHAGRYPLRAAIAKVNDDAALIESTLVEFDSGDRIRQRFTGVELIAPRRKHYQDAKFAVVQIVPTGVRCEIGGYAGDACPVTNLLAASADLVITHPNAVNASELNEMAGNVLYVEGRSLDDFLLGHLALVPTRSNRIGTFVDRTGVEYLDDVVSTLNAARAVGGIDCGIYTVSAEELGVRTLWSETGCAVGTVRNPAAILEAVEHLLAQGVQAVGGVSVIHGVTADEFARHLSGKIPNPSGGVEAIITHLISKAFRVPTAHAHYRTTRMSRPAERTTHAHPQSSSLHRTISVCSKVLRGRLVLSPSGGSTKLPGISSASITSEQSWSPQAVSAVFRPWLRSSVKSH